MPLPPTKSSIEEAARIFLECDIAQGSKGVVIIRGGELGAFVIAHSKTGVWVDAFWTGTEEAAQHVVDVTGKLHIFL